MSTVRVDGCCDDLIDLDYNSDDVCYEKATGLAYHADCALKLGLIAEDAYENSIQEF